MGGIFRAYDIRGVYPGELNDEIAYKVGRAYAVFMKKENGMDEAVVSCDCRLSSPALKRFLIAGIRDGGINVLDVGDAPVPVFYFTIANLGKAGGIMVTGSHNPKNYNGLKLQRKDAKPIVAETGISEIEKLANAGKFEKTSGKTVHKKIDMNQAYIDYVFKKIFLKIPLKIVLDTGNGSCANIPEKIFSSLGCTVETLFPTPDGNFPNHQPDPHDENSLEALKKRVIETNADMGLAFDGDGDRIGLVDEKGNTITGDFILMMLARQALESRKGTVVFEVRASNTLIEDVKSRKGAPIITRAGHSYLLDEIIASNAVFGGEITGHMYFPYCYYNYDDGIFAGLKLAEIVSELAAKHIKLSEYVAGLPRNFSTPEIFIESTDDTKFKIVDELKKYLEKNKYDFLGIDGARINFKHGWGLARASNTTPHIKCRFEADTKEHLDEILAEAKSILKKVGVELKV
ncbi:MAG: phosphomannomutase/phosphoglucomutase [Nanoarchaeota archaeon]|nr:phosphomannomutase/phosphoglucomutase [Nanoarchaeota archaeon]MBU4300047.1 phosphomannomutase/phosphoglucomutase [Nanoarchaeota archaeon]MBU4451848.1 phosphomannomutase/phosphoglucomutase [Nanoarchaeota archaeon]MCG2724416.1 phosphomannomutase/phosphoglucomutase [archaeon]